MVQVKFRLHYRCMSGCQLQAGGTDRRPKRHKSYSVKFDGNLGVLADCNC